MEPTGIVTPSFNDGSRPLGRVDKASAGAHDAIDKVSDAARPMVDRLASGAHQAVDKIASAAGQAAETLGVKGEQLEECPGASIGAGARLCTRAPRGGAGHSRSSRVCPEPSAEVDSLDATWKMEPTKVLDRTSEPVVVGGVAPAVSSLLEDVKSLWHELRGLVHDQLTLAALEARSAGNSLVTMIAAGVMVAALLVSAWLGLMGAAVLWLISIGVMASIAMLLAVVANLALALILYDVIRRQSRHLQFRATLRSLRPVPTARLNSPDREGREHATTT